MTLIALRWLTNNRGEKATVRGWRWRTRIVAMRGCFTSMLARRAP